MNFSDVLDIATGVSAIACPALTPIIGAVNAFIGDDDPIPDNATGDQVMQRINRLPPEQRTRLLEMQLDLKKMEVMAKRDMHVSDNDRRVEMFKILSDASQQTTRPDTIAKFAWDVRVVTWGSLVVLGIMMVLTDGKPDWTALAALGGFTATILSTQNSVIKRYFNVLETEQRNAIEGSLGNVLSSGQQAVSQASGMVDRFKSAFK